MTTFQSLFHEAVPLLDDTDRLAVEHAILRVPADHDLRPNADEFDAAATVGPETYLNLWLDSHLAPVRPHLSETTHRISANLTKRLMASEMPEIARRGVGRQIRADDRSNQSDEEGSGVHINIREEFTERLRSLQAEEVPKVVQELTDDESSSVSYPLKRALIDVVSESAEEYGSVYGSLTAFPAAIVKELLSAVNEDDSIPLESLPLDELLSELNKVVRNRDEWPAETRHWALWIIQILIVNRESKWVMHHWGALASTVLTGLTDPNPESSDDPKMRENDTRLVTHRLSAPPALRRSYESVRPEAISTGIELLAFDHSSDERVDGSPTVLDVQTAIEDRIDDPTIEEAAAFGSVFFSTDQALGEEILENIFDPDAALTSVFRAGWFSCLREIHKLAVERQEPYVIPPGEFPDRIAMSIKVVSDRDDPYDIELQILAQTLVNAFMYDLPDVETWLRRFLNETPPGTSDAVASRVVPTENFFPDMWSDVKALWELRLEMVSDPSAHAREFALYCRWLHHDDLSLTL